MEDLAAHSETARREVKPRMPRAVTSPRTSGLVATIFILVIGIVASHSIDAWAQRHRVPPAAADEDDEPPPPVRRPDLPTKATTSSEPAETTPEKKEALVEPPADWPDAEKIEALTKCVTALAPLKMLVSEPRSIRQGQCGGPALIEVQALEINQGEVTLRPGALINCDVAVRLHEFIANDLQPLAMKLLGSPITRIENVGGYQCRGVVGTVSRRKLSEHAYANAIDMGVFITADGRRISLIDDWGETVRDVAARKAAAKSKPSDRPPTHKTGPAEDDKDKAADKASKDEEAGPPPLPERAPEGATVTVQRQKRHRDRKTTSKPAQPEAKQPRIENPQPTARVFLRKLHEAGCQRFSTALGPEANDAHRDHFHFDLAVRRNRSFCE